MPALSGPPRPVAGCGAAQAAARALTRPPPPPVPAPPPLRRPYHHHHQRGAAVAASGLAPCFIGLRRRSLPVALAAAASDAAAAEAAASTAAPGSRRSRRQQQQQQRRKPNRGEQERRGRQQQQGGGDGSEDHAAPRDAVLFVGFHPEEMDLVRQHLPDMVHSYGTGAGAAVADAADGGYSLPVLDVTRRMLPLTVAAALQRHAAHEEGEHSRATGASSSEQGTQPDAEEEHGVHIGDGDGGDGDEAAVEAGRVVLLVGPAAQALGGALNDELAGWGVVPAVIAAYQHGRHAGMPLGQLVAALRQAHAEYYQLLQPVQLDPAGAAPLDPAVAAGEQDEAAAGPGRDSSSRSSSSSSSHAAVLADARVVLCAAIDAGEVPSIHGTYRPDAGHVVVLDGLLTGKERASLLDWVTAPGHDHGGPPPADKWALSCVDRTGDRATWGLQPHVLAALAEAPPPPVVALQARLAALYPEYDICHMPADSLSSYGNGNGDGDGDDAPVLSSFVGNAVVFGDPCAWHTDADPTTVPPHSPWVHNFGFYHNRELDRPLFVTAVLYINDSWPEDNHAETLVLDPASQLGLFVRPAPGRVLLLEQDVPHRISAPSRDAPGPRYSLVWKLVFVPKRGHIAGSDGQHQSICRPEWGEPLRLGSANSHAGVRAYQPRAG